MSQLITLGSELIRINPQNTTHLQYSYNQGQLAGQIHWFHPRPIFGLASCRHANNCTNRQRDVLFQRFRPHLAI